MANSLHLCEYFRQLYDNVIIIIIIIIMMSLFKEDDIFSKTY